MDRLGVNHAVYSTHLKGYEPDLQEKNIIIYIHAKSMVVVCFDLCGNREESCLSTFRCNEGDESSCYKHIPASEYSWCTSIRK